MNTTLTIMHMALFGCYKSPSPTKRHKISFHFRESSSSDTLDEKNKTTMALPPLVPSNHKREKQKRKKKLGDIISF